MENHTVPKYYPGLELKNLNYLPQIRWFFAWLLSSSSTEFHKNIV